MLAAFRGEKSLNFVGIRLIKSNLGKNGENERSLIFLVSSEM